MSPPSAPMTMEIVLSTTEAHAVMETRPASQPLHACSRLHTVLRLRAGHTQPELADRVRVRVRVRVRTTVWTGD